MPLKPDSPFPIAGLRVALIHDWLNGMRGGERVLEHFCALFPSADVYTLLYEPDNLSPAIREMNVVESDFARLPGAYEKYRYYLPVMPWYVSQIPTDEYDLVISTSHCVAKGARRPSRGLHLSYIFSPMRYVWDHYDDYLSGTWWKDAGLRAVRPWLQKWDRSSCANVDSFAADSHHIARKIARFWKRQARVLHPPVELDRFQPTYQPPEDFFLVASAFVPYKKIGRAIEAAAIANVRMVVVGGGPEEERLREMAGPNVEFAGRVSDEELVSYYQRARALIFPATEDFGITALEAMACGRPVLAYRQGGVTETVVDGETGAFFDEPAPKSLACLLTRHNDDKYDAAAIRRRAEQFSPNRFRSALVQWIRSEARFLL